MEGGPGRVDEDHTGSHGCELCGSDHAHGLRGDRCVHRDHVGALEEFVEAHGGLVGVGVVGDDLHAEPTQPPSRARATAPVRPVRPSSLPAPRLGSADRGWSRPCRSPHAARRHRRRSPGGWRRTGGRRSARPPRRRCVPVPGAPVPRPRWPPPRRHCSGHPGSCTRR